MNNTTFEDVKKIKIIASLNKNANRLDNAMPYKLYEDMKSPDMKIPEMDCLKEYNSLQLNIDNFEIPKSDKYRLDSLKQNDVVTFSANIKTIDTIAMHVEIEIIKIWNIKKYKRPKAFELLSNLGRSQLFMFHFIDRVSMKITNLDMLLG